MSTFNEKLTAIVEADEAGDELASLKANKAMLISLMFDPNLELKERIKLSETVSKLGLEIVRLAGLTRTFSGEEEEDIDEVAYFNRIYGKEGKGHDDE